MLPVNSAFSTLTKTSKPLCVALALVAAPSIGVVSPTMVAAQTAENATGGKARVNRSASLRSLAETIAGASCRANSGIETTLAQSQLATASNDFSRILDGLTNGSAALGMPGAETRARSLTALQETAAVWGPMNDAAASVVSDAGNGAAASIIADSYKGLTDQTKTLASVISGQYADPQQLLQSDATVLNFAVRQRELLYRMGRAMCELATGTGGEQALADLQSSTELFQQTLIALRDGFAAAGINPPPNDAIRDNLQAIVVEWQNQSGIFDGALAGDTPDATAVIISAALTNALSDMMQNVITLYLIAAPGQEAVYRVPLEAYAREELSKWLSNPDLIAAIKAQNIEHAGLTEDAVIALDQQWRAEAGAGGGPLITELLSSDLSGWLLEQQNATAGFVTEVFIMDDKGLNVAQSAQTSDYWQGDEAKWQQTYGVGPDALHISEVEFDDSTGFYQSQASIAISDPATGAVIGAVTFGINVQSLL